MELIRDPDGAYSQLIRLQEGDNQAEAGPSRISKSSSRGNPRRHSSSGSFSHISMISSPSPRQSFSLSPAIPDLTGAIEMGFGKESTVTEDQPQNEKRPRKVSLLRLAYLNKPETPVLLLGSIAAGLHGAIFPLFGLMIGIAIEIFYEPPNELTRDSRLWAFMFMGLGILTFVIVPFQNYLFGIAGGKLIQRICSLSFEKVVHQEISWFDDPENSRFVKYKYLLLISRNFTVVPDILKLYCLFISAVHWVQD